MVKLTIPPPSASPPNLKPEFCVKADLKLSGAGRGKSFSWLENIIQSKSCLSCLFVRATEIIRRINLDPSKCL